MDGSQTGNLGALRHFVGRNAILDLTVIAKQTVVVLNFLAIAVRS
jgi:hypothetical protein